MLASFQSLLAQAPPGVTFLHVFDGGSSGANPVTSVVQTPDFSLAGVAFGQQQFATTGGVLYTVSPTGKFTVLHQFPASGRQGDVYEGQYASIMQASDQNFYGTFSRGGGAPNAGTIYRVTPTGTYIQIHAFSGLKGDGGVPLGPLVEAFDGNLYGVVSTGPGGGGACIFRVGLDGSFSEVYVLDPTLIGFPTAGFTLGPDGNLYGVANRLNVYQFNPATNTAAVLFTGTVAGEIDTMVPVLGFDGRLYFSDENPAVCACQNGSIISFGLDGSGPEFDYLFNQTGFGASNLMLTGDGTFYSFVAAGNASTAEGINVAAQSVTLYSLAGIGNNANQNLTQLANGALAGTAHSQGDNGRASGTLFLLNTGTAKPAPFILGFEPQAASAGQTVTVWGSSFVGATQLL